MTNAVDILKIALVALACIVAVFTARYCTILYTNHERDIFVDECMQAGRSKIECKVLYRACGTWDQCVNDLGEVSE